MGGWRVVTKVKWAGGGTLRDWRVELKVGVLWEVGE